MYFWVTTKGERTHLLWSPKKYVKKRIWLDTTIILNLVNQYSEHGTMFESQ